MCIKTKVEQDNTKDEAITLFKDVFGEETVKINFKNMKLLKSLMNYFMDDLYVSSSKYEKMRVELVKTYDELEELFTVKEQELFEKVVDISNNMKSELEEQLFLFGFIMGTELKVEKITEGENYNTVVTALGTDVSRFVLYDISLISENSKIQPNGKVKISIPVPEGFDTSNITVYRVAEDGTKTEYEVTVSNGYIVFEADHFSNYVVAEKGTTNNSSVEETSTTNDTATNNEDTTTSEETTKTENTTTPTETTRKKDDTPKTGNANNNLYIFIAGITVVGIVFMVKRNKKRVK